MRRHLATWLTQPSNGDQTLGWRDGQPVSERAWRQQAERWHARLAALPTASVALYLQDGLEFAAALFAAWHAGKTVLLPGDALSVTATQLRSDGAALVGDWPQGQLRAPGTERAAFTEALDEECVQLFVYTSGSTGAPTAIPKRLRQFSAEVAALEAAFGAQLGGAAMAGSVSHQHIYGLLFRVLWPLAAGRPLIAERAAYFEDVLQQAGGPLALVASPAHLKRLQPVDLKGLQARLVAIFSSGGPLPEAASIECEQRLGQAPIEVYGSSETGGVAWRQLPADSTWRALPGVDWRIDDEALALRSPHLPDGAWLRTQDRALADGTGFILLGRADRIVKLEEKRISLNRVEQALAEHPWVQQASALLLTGKRSELAVVLHPSAAGMAAWAEQGKARCVAAWRAHLAQQFEPGALPRRWRLLQQWPVNAQGKTPQALLLALFDPLRPAAQLLEASATAARYRLTPEASSPAFDGHFAANPVLPGVVQIDWAERLARERWSDMPAHFAGMEQLKFQQVITPGLMLELQLEWDGDALLRFAFQSARGAHASGRLKFVREALA